MSPGYRVAALLLVSASIGGSAAGAPLTPGNLLVSENDVLREYTPAGGLVQSFPIPYPGGRPGGEDARDVFVDSAGLVHVFNGTWDPYVSTLDPTAGTWTHNTFADWDAGGNISYGGVTFFLGFVFATDVGAPQRGIVGFDTGAGYAGERFAGTADYIDITLGLDSLLYALRQNEWDIDVYDPYTRGLLRTVTLANPIRGCAVNLAGNFFCASWDGSIYHFAPNGSLVNSRITGFNNLVDIDITFAGDLVAGSRFGNVIRTDVSLASQTSFTAGSFQTFVAYTVSSIPPARVPFFTATSRDGENFLEWLNPAGGSYFETMIRYTAVPTTSSCTPPVLPSDGTLLVTQAGSPGVRDFATHGGLANDNTTYCYTAFVDGAGGGPYSGGRTTRGRPFDSSTGNVRWAFQTGAASMTPPSLGTGVYAVSNDRSIYAITPGAAGGGTWLPGFTPAVLGEPAQNRSPAVLTDAITGSDEVLFVGSQDGYAYAFDAKTGERKWRTKLGDMVQAAPAGMFTDFLGAYDYILVGTRNTGTFDNFFYAMNVSDGAVVGAPFSGAAQGGIGIISAGAAVDYGLDRVFFASRRRPSTGVITVWALDLSGTGVSYAWGRALDEIDGAPTRCGSQVFVGTNTGQVHALASGDGAPLWSYPTGDGPVKSFVFPDCITNSLYLSTTTKVWGLTVSSPTPNWPAVTSIPSPSTPTFLPRTSYLFVGGSDGRLYQLDLSVANSTTPPAITFVVLGDGLSAVGRPTIDRASGIAYVGTDGGAFYAVEIPIP